MTDAAAAAAEVAHSNNVYIMSKDHAWIPARVIESSETEAKVSVFQYKDEQSIQSDGGKASRGSDRKTIALSDYPSKALPLQNVDEKGVLSEVEDMVDLPFLHEAAILYNLKSRHVRGKPYTRTGDIVIAVNPYKWMNELYSEEVRHNYGNRLVWDFSAGQGDVRSTIEPHVYETSSLSYRGLAVDGQNQSILVSGESGAGKTETVKILMSHIASVQAPVASDNLEQSFASSPIVQRVLDSNPLLEAFGNAKTVRNDNSSRFGKFIQLQFDAEDPTHAAYAGKSIPSCVLAGSKSEVYLLEKSRVVGHEEEERTYHIFYQLLAAPQEVKTGFWEGLGDTDNESFSYVGWTDTNFIEGKDDAERFQLTVDALALVGVDGNKLRTLMRAICIVLQLGNLSFEPNEADEEKTDISSIEELQDLAGLMGVEQQDIKNSLTQRTVRARNEEYKVPLKAVQAKDSCDAFAKEIYAKAFLWLVKTINNATCAENNYDRRVSGGFATIGLLDIFGFESFETNRFEQLCINYANEKLQQKFTQDIFRSVQTEYEEEGIALGEITYEDNVDVLNLVEGRMGLIAVLNEECVRPKGNDVAFVSKVQAMNKDSDCLISEKSFRDYEFGVTHYAGPVIYEATNFVSKNMDNLPKDLLECAEKSSNDIVRKALTYDEVMASTPTKAKKRSKASGPPPRSLTRKGSTLVQESVWGKFRNQLTSLMATLSETRTRYIRCIKPNAEKQPKLMQHLSTVEQLRCAGVVAAVTISRSAFPNRLEHEVILERFKSLWTKDHLPALGDTELSFDEIQRRNVGDLLSTALKSLEFMTDGETVKAFVIGKTRAYFRVGALEYLEADRLKGLSTWAIEIQRIVRGFLARYKYHKLRQAAIKIETNTRRTLARKRYVGLRSACITIQCQTRCSMAKAELLRLREDYRATMIQTHWRMAVANVMFKQHRNAAIVIQAIARGAIQRPKFQRDIIEKREEAKLENQLKTLQRRLEEAEARRIQAEKEADERRIAAEEKAKEATEPVVVYRESPASVEQAKHEEDLPGRAAVELQPADQPATVGQLTEQQQNLMDESGKMLEYLRKEVFKLRSQNSQLRTDFDLLKENNQRLMDANASAGASFAALNQHAKQLNKTNARLVADLSGHKQQIHKLNLTQVELKEELKLKQATYIAEVHSRLQYQNTMGRIVDTIQEQCRDTGLVEDILAMSDECERAYMNGCTALESDSLPLPPSAMPPTNESSFTQNTRSITGALRSFFS